MKTNEGQLIYTTEECIGCNKCIGVCSCIGANRASSIAGKNRILVDPDLCIACGACFDVCEHHARKYMGLHDSLAFISPCIAKKKEITDPNTYDNVQYNVTFDHLITYIKEHNLTGNPYHEIIDYGLGAFYPMPGGLKQNPL